MVPPTCVVGDECNLLALGCVTTGMEFEISAEAKEAKREIQSWVENPGED